MGRASASGARSRLSPLSGEASRYRTCAPRGRGCPCTPNSGEGLSMSWERPRGQPRGRAVPPGGFKRAGAKSCFVALATDVLHEGAEASRGDDRAGRLAAGEGLPGGRHRLGEHANSSSCLAPSGLRFCGDPPTILRARSASYASEACLGASEDASRPEARLSLSVNLSFHPRFVACGAASSPAPL